MSGSALASSFFGTATRTISHPADASAAICAVVASTSCVFVRVIDCTTTGAPPPIATPPTRIWCALAIAVRVPAPRRGPAGTTHVQHGQVRSGRVFVPGTLGPCTMPGVPAEPLPRRGSSRRRRTTTRTISGRSVPTSRREPSLAAYRIGLFPMPVGARIGWFSPATRGVVPLEPFAPSRTLRRARQHYEIRVDTAFARRRLGMRPSRRPGQLDRPGIEAAYEELHELGWAHSVEAWDDGRTRGRALRRRDRRALRRRVDVPRAHRRLQGRVRRAGRAACVRQATPIGRLLDVQWLTPHLETLGAVDVSRADYRPRGPAH